MFEVCFVCTGNTCRSVMAERIARKKAKENKIENCKFSSAGINATKENITENAKLALKTLGYDGRNRKSVKLNEKTNCIFVCVTENHKKFVRSKNVISFKDLAMEVNDPYGQDLQVYLQCAKQIEKNVDVLLRKIVRLRGEK